MLKKVMSALVGTGFALASVFAAAPASATSSRYAGNIDQDWGGTYLNGVSYEEAGSSDGSSEWQASVTDGNSTYVAGMDWDTDSVVVQKITDGERDMTFGTSGTASLHLTSDAYFNNVGDIDVTTGGDILITGTFWDEYTVWENWDLEGVFALQINSSGGNTGITFGNSDGDALDAGSLNIAAFYPDWKNQPNNPDEYGWYQDVADTVEMNINGDIIYAIAGSVDDDYDGSAYVMYVNGDGTIAAGFGDSTNTDGVQFLDWDYNIDSGFECYNWSGSNGLVYSSYSDDLYLLANCDGDSLLVALDPFNSGLIDTSFATADYYRLNYGGGVFVDDYANNNAEAWILDTDSNGNLIVAGDTYEYLPNYDDYGWVPYIARYYAEGGYYNYMNIDEGWDENFYNVGDVDWFDLEDVTVGADDSVYLTGSVYTGNDRQLFAQRYDSNLAVDNMFNDEDHNGVMIYGSCGDEYSFTSAIQGDKLYLFGRGHNPVSATESPWGYSDAMSARVGLVDWTQTRNHVSAPSWTDDEWSSEYIPGELYSDSVTAAGTGVNYYLSGDLPSNVSLANDGSISGTPDIDDDSNYNQYVCAANAGGHVWTEGYIEPPSPYSPNIGSTPNLETLNAFEGTELTWNIAIDAYPTDVDCWIEEGELPAGLELDEDTCVVTGTPRIVGDYYFVIGAENYFDGGWHEEFAEFGGTVEGDLTADIDAQLLADRGDLAEGSVVDMVGYGLDPDSDWYAELHSDPVTIASGVANEFGWFNFSAELPADIEPGEHTITVYGTDVNGHEMTAVVYITVAADGTLGYISTVQSESASLAHTGVDSQAMGNLALGGLIAMVLGSLVIYRRRAARV